MQKLIKLSDQHYVVADDSEIKVDDWYVGWANNYSTEPNQRWVLYNLVSTTNGDTPRKITHSTEPLEYKYGSQKQGFNMGTMSSDIELVYDQIKPLSLSEVEEAINGYSVEKLALSLDKSKCRNFRREHTLTETYEGIIDGFIEGFKAHQELVKDKMFTVEDIEKLAFHITDNFVINSWENREYKSGKSIPTKQIVKDYIQSLQQTEWDVEVEMEEINEEETIASNGGFSLKVPVNIQFVPKITNNSIKVLRIL